MAVTVGPGGIEEIAAEIDGALQRVKRPLVVGAGPAAHAPHTIADFADVPSRAAEAAVAHYWSPFGFSRILL